MSRFAVAPSLLLLVVLACTAVALPAYAEEDAAQLLIAGKKALRARRADEASKLFQRGMAVASSEPQRWQMQLGLALAEVLAKRYQLAAQHYRAFLRASAAHSAAGTAPWNERRRKARQDLVRLEAQLLETHARVDIQSEPPGATVMVNGIAMRWTTPAVAYLPPGNHQIALALDGYVPEALPLAVEPGQQPFIHRKLSPDKLSGPASAGPPDPLTPKPAPLPAPPVATMGDRDEARPSDGLLANVGALSLSSGIASAIVAVGLHASALQQAAELRDLQSAFPSMSDVARDRLLRDRIGDYQAAYIVLYAVAGVASVAGTSLLVYRVARGKPQVRAALGPGAAVVWGTF